MSRVLQIRRGTTAQNNNFTGLPGEITFDTDAKTIRVHDGQTLGGFIVGNGAENTVQPVENPFDINSVPDEFWVGMLNRLMPPAIRHIDSPAVQFQLNAGVDYIFSDITTPLFAQPILVCTSNDAGYNIGDEAFSFGIGSNTVTAPNIFTDSSGTHARLMIGGQNFWVSHKSTAVKTEISHNKWRVKFRLYY